jgi:hypothetical protein
MKTIAVLLMLSVVLSSCGKKDKDKSNDFLRVTPPPTNSQSSEPNKTGVVKSYLEALNDCINIHMSCPVPSDECSKAKVEDPKRLSLNTTNLWQACIDSPPCSEKMEDFLKARLDCINFDIDLNKARKSCLEAKLACPPDEAKDGCPAAKLACDKADKKYRATSLTCPYSEIDCFEATNEPCSKAYKTGSEAEKVCSDDDKSWKACDEAALVFLDFQMQCFESHKSCVESELNGTTYP